MDQTCYSAPSQPLPRPPLWSWSGDQIKRSLPAEAPHSCIAEYGWIVLYIILFIGVIAVKHALVTAIRILVFFIGVHGFSILCDFAEDTPFWLNSPFTRACDRVAGLFQRKSEARPHHQYVRIDNSHSHYDHWNAWKSSLIGRRVLGQERLRVSYKIPAPKMKSPNVESSSASTRYNRLRNRFNRARQKPDLYGNGELVVRHFNPKCFMIDAWLGSYSDMLWKGDILAIPGIWSLEPNAQFLVILRTIYSDEI